VGALLQIHDHASAKSYIPTYDGSGNVVALVNASSGAVAAAYEYGPFGEPLRAEVSDSAVTDNPFRFSTKYTDAETGLAYFGYRYYSATLGRFINRDPSGEAGGVNLYGFCANDGINSWDVLGLGTGSGHIETDPGVLANPWVDVASTYIPQNSFDFGGGFSVIGIDFNTLFRGGSGGGSSGNSPSAKQTGAKKDPNKTDPCPGLKASLAQAQSIAKKNQAYFNPGGQFSSLAASGALGDFDHISMAGTVGGFGVAVWTDQVSHLPTQTSANLGRGMTGYKNVVGQARFVGGVARGFGFAGTALDAASFIEATERGDGAGMLLSGGNVGYGIAGLALGGPFGLAAGGAQLLVNGSLYLYQQHADARDFVNTFASAQSSLSALQNAQTQVGQISREMAEKGCN
jgi:RHS repeat-associated protein